MKIVKNAGLPRKVVADDWPAIWRGMPEYHQDDLRPWKSVKVHFRDPEDMERFADMIGQKLTGNTKSVWYPKAALRRYAGKVYVSENPVNPRHPVYVISKGRWKSRLTSKALEKIGVPYRIVVEPQECDQYAAVIDPAKILVLPFSNLGQGSIPARNWVWDHAVREGARWHWILDDNIRYFCRYNYNLKVPVGDGTVFRVIEDFAERYENVAQAGFNYRCFVNGLSKHPPMILNTRIYSCILIRNDIPYRWRGRYNEDTDLSLRILKDGWCMVLFNAFLARKEPTMTMKGGNTDELYQGNGRLLMAQSLQEQHPDVVKITQKWGRPQHHVNYKVFRDNKLVLRPGVVVPSGTDNRGMRLQILAG